MPTHYFLKFVFCLMCLFLSIPFASISSVSALQRDLTNTAEQVRLQETLKREAEEKLKSLEQEKCQTNFHLKKQFRDLGIYLKALRKLKLMASVSVLNSSTSPEKIIQSTLIFNALIRQILLNAKNTKRELKVLQETQNNVEIQRLSAHQATESFAQKYQQLESFLRQRKQILARETDKRRALELKAHQWAKNSQNIHDLIQEIDLSQPDKKEKSRMQTGKGYRVKPVLGPLESSFGTKNQLNSEGMGVVFRAEPHSLVYAPLDTQVVYAGPFRKYNHMVILSHDHHYHTVILGLGEIDVVVGQSLLAGEPIGYTVNQTPSFLYLELREKGSPINPSSWLKETR